MSRKTLIRFLKSMFLSLPFRPTILPLFLLLLVVFLFPQNLSADKGPFYFLEYGGLLFLRYLPFVGLAAIVKLYLLKRKFSLKRKAIGKIAVKTIAEIYAEIIYFLLLFFFLSPIIHEKILDKIGFIANVEKNPAALKLLFSIIIQLPLQCLLAAILNFVLLYSYWSDETNKSIKDFPFALLLSFIFPAILIAFAAAGFFSGYQTPLL